MQNKLSVLDLLLRASESTTEGNDPAVDLSDEQIVSHCLNFLVAAYDTTSFSLATCSFLLATHPRVQDKLCDHLDQYWNDNPVSLPCAEISINDCTQHTECFLCFSCS